MKLIASDLDGTLLVSHSEIGTKNLKALRYAREKGVKFVASSGRTLNGVNVVFNKTGFEPDYIISCNGTLIFSGDGQVIRKKPLNKEKAIEVLKYLEDNDFCYSISCEDTMYCLNSSYTRIKNEYENGCAYGDNQTTGSLVDFYNLFQSRKGIINVDSYLDVLNTGKEIYSIICISIDKNRLIEGSNGISHISGLTITSSAKNNFEVYDENASKGIALKYIANKLNIPMSETMALGDNFNDLSMLEAAEISVAMGNAHDNIKEKCSFVTYNNTENGFAHAIYEFI